MKKKPTESELGILQVLWQNGASTVRFVNEVLNKNRGATDTVGYTTTLKLMQIMLKKELLKRNANSRTHIYEANITEEDTQKSLLNKFLKTTFRGSTSTLIMQALGNHKTSSEEIQEIRNFLDQLEED
ncbi:MAG: BlaI/MecI/CopY family transcriptional regulator [Chitinophagales bacterium]